MPKFLSTVQFLNNYIHVYASNIGRLLQNEILSKFLVIYSQFQVKVTEITSHEDEITGSEN